MTAQLAAVIAAPTLEHKHLGSTGLSHNFCGHGRILNDRGANLQIFAAQHENPVQSDFCTSFGTELLHTNLRAFFVIAYIVLGTSKNGKSPLPQQFRFVKRFGGNFVAKPSFWLILAQIFPGSKPYFA